MMILLDTAKDTTQTSTSPINLSTSNDENESTLSFSQLLKGIGNTKDNKTIQNGALILSLDTDDKNIGTTKTDSKKDILLNLLKNDDTKTSKEAEPLVLNPKITAEMSTTEVKVLVGDAKKYLETQILSSDEYKQSQIKELPKTLKGLVEAAKIIGLDISKISIEEIQVKSTNEIPKQQQQQQELKIAPALSNAKENLQENPKSDVRVQLSDVLNARKTPSSDDLKVQTKQLQSEKVVDELKISTQHPKGEKVVDELKAQVQHPKSEKVVDEVKVQTQHPKSEKIVDEVKAQTQRPKSEKVVDEMKSQVQHPKTEKVVEDVKTEVKHPPSDKTTNEPKSALKLQANEQKVQTPRQEQTQEIKQTQETKQTPLFKAQVQTEHTTEQLVLTKASSSVKLDERTPKERADETLKLLLRGEKPQQSGSTSMTADFSVATAKVLSAPSTLTQMAVSQTAQTTQTLEQMLRGDSSDSKSESITGQKTDTTGVLKADSFEVKLNEAKQMVKYLSNDVKTAIDDYKSPFTRIKVQLNPQNLGEIDLTIVQRGKNLHVNLSSNNVAINTLAMNINDLKVQLSNNGINNASFNFSNNQDGGNSASSQQQQQRQNEQQAQQEYNYFDNEETNEDILDSLEIVVPQYI